MDSPLARVILTVIGGYIVILIFLTAYDWYRKEYPGPPIEPTNTERIQHPFYHEQAVEAVQQFNRLSPPEKHEIKKSLETHLVSMEGWLIQLGQSDYQVVCMGEFHEESTRQFLSDEFFSKFNINTLMLEGTSKTLKRIFKRKNAGRVYFPLLNADILNVLHAVETKNPDIKIYGIEETDEQQEKVRGKSGSRENAIAGNFWNHFEPGMRHIILIGAFHCTNEPNWLFENLRSQAPPPLKDQMLNIQVLGEHQDGPLEAFIFFLDEIGIEKNHFVIPDTSALHNQIYAFFHLLNRQTLEKYSALIVFRS